MKQKVNFDRFKDNYNDLMQKQHRIFGDISYYSEYKVFLAKKLLNNHQILNILEYGCGIGRNLKYLKNAFPKAIIYGTDISNGSLEIAKKNNPFVNIVKLQELDRFENYFDLIFIAGVYHHIEPQIRENVTRNIYLLQKNGGNTIVFEHNPYNPVTRMMVNTCEFDKDAVLLSKRELIDLFKRTGFIEIGSGYTLFFPPRLKKLNFIEPYLRVLPLGGQYYVIFKKPKTNRFCSFEKD